MLEVIRSSCSTVHDCITEYLNHATTSEKIATLVRSILMGLVLFCPMIIGVHLVHVLPFAMGFFLLNIFFEVIHGGYCRLHPVR